VNLLGRVPKGAANLVDLVTLPKAAPWFIEGGGETLRQKRTGCVRVGRNRRPEGRAASGRLSLRGLGTQGPRSFLRKVGLGAQRDEDRETSRFTHHSTQVTRCLGS